MSNITRRYFVLSAVALPVGCALQHPSRQASSTSTATVRAPQTGQYWRYIKRDAISGGRLDMQVDSVTAVGSVVNIDSRSETDAGDKPLSWGMSWLRKNLTAPKNAVTQSAEVQQPWGMILVDPHWSESQVFETPIPLWPGELRPGWHSHVNTKYKTLAHEEGLPWEQTMTAHAWEPITVPAGRFTALRYTNRVNFVSTDFGRRTSMRRETLWFAPQVGRWVARESIGTYYLSNSFDDTLAYEPSFRWELQEWA